MTPPKIISLSRTRGAPVPQHIQQRCVDRIVECQKLVKTAMASPTVSFDLRGTTAGEAYSDKNHIRLNGQLLNENTEHFIEQTVGHEWAHLAARHLHGPRIRSHGPEWKSVMVKLGLDPARCHTYATQKARVVKAKPKTKTQGRAWVGKINTPIRPTGKPVLPPKPTFGSPADVVIEIRIPGMVPASTVMWSYANKLATKKSMPLPEMLQHSQAMLTQWIGMAKQR